MVVIMVITKWTNPIHECQQGEVRREWFYLNQYYTFYGNLDQFAELLKYSFKLQHTETPPENNELYDKYLEKHPICFHPDDIRNGKPPSKHQVYNWSRGQNISSTEKHNWDDRRGSKQNEVSKLAEQNAAATIAEQLPYIIDCVVKGFQETDEAVKYSKSIGSFTPHQAESATKSRLHVIDSLLKATNKDKNYNVKADVNEEIKADVKQQTTAEVKMQKLKELREKMEQMSYD